MPRRPPPPTEHHEQATLIEWCALTSRAPGAEALARVYAIPNGTSLVPRNATGAQRKRAAIHGAKLKAEGVRAGYPDLGLDVAADPYHGLRIEMKRQRGGRVSPDQRAWHDWLRDEGYRVEVCRGWVEAARVLVDYLDLPGRLAPDR